MRTEDWGTEPRDTEDWGAGDGQLKALFAPRAGFKAIAIDLPNARRLAFSVVLGQAVVTVVAALLAWSIAGRNAALSALLGGGISTVASLAMAALSFARTSGANAHSALAAFYAGEAAKVAVVIVLFVVVLKTMKVVPLAMLGAYMATFLVFWVALANAMPTRGLPDAGRGVRADADRLGT